MVEYNMTVTATNSRNTYTSDGATLIYPFTFQVLADLNASVTILPTDVSVYFGAALQSSSNYTVNGPVAGSNPNSVVLNPGTALAAGVIITIVRNKPLTQTSRDVDNTPCQRRLSNWRRTS